MGYILGVDGGGTGTIAILTDENGTILASAQAGASNYHAVGKEEASAALHQIIHEVVENADQRFGDCQAAAFGIAGLNHPSDADFFHSVIDPIGLAGKVTIENDMVIAWAAATSCKPGVVIIAGTGSSAFGVNADGQRVKTLGWDYVLADQGSGYWIGLHGIQAAIKTWDGRLEDTCLLNAMVACYELQIPEDMIKLAYQEGFDKPEIARFAKEVSKCAHQGDKVCQGILHQAGEELAQAVCAVVKRLRMSQDSFTVGLIGGTFRSGKFLMEPFRRDVLAFAPKAHIEPARYSAAIGAVIYAHYLNGTLDDNVLAQLEATSTEAIRWKT